MNQSKPTVQYELGSLYVRGIGEGAWLVPVDHPSADGYNLTNGRLATTSAIVSYNEVTGEVETKNTRYVPVAFPANN